MTTSLLNMVKEGSPKLMLSSGWHGVLYGFPGESSPQSCGTKKERSEANITWGVVSRDVRWGMPVNAVTLQKSSRSVKGFRVYLAEVAEECKSLAPPLHVFVFLLLDAVS
jgi:hypothetical protein